MDPQEVVLKVVMVDDEEALCQGVRRIIERYDVHVADVLVDAAYEYRYFTTGEDFLVYLSEGGEVDLLLLDLKLPGLGGMDVLDALSTMGRDVLTIMITAYATFETAVKATKLGAYDFLAKPFTPDELRYAVRKATSQLILSRQARKLAVMLATLSGISEARFFLSRGSLARSKSISGDPSRLESSL